MRQVFFPLKAETAISVLFASTGWREVSVCVCERARARVYVLISFCQPLVQTDRGYHKLRQNLWPFLRLQMWKRITFSNLALSVSRGDILWSRLSGWFLFSPAAPLIVCLASPLDCGKPLLIRKLCLSNERICSVRFVKKSEFGTRRWHRLCAWVSVSSEALKGFIQADLWVTCLQARGQIP